MHKRGDRRNCSLIFKFHGRRNLFLATTHALKCHSNRSPSYYYYYFYMVAVGQAISSSGDREFIIVGYPFDNARVSFPVTMNVPPTGSLTFLWLPLRKPPEATQMTIISNHDLFESWSVSHVRIIITIYHSVYNGTQGSS